MILVSMDKQVLREVYKRQRLAMSAAEVKSKSRLIGRNLLNEVDWWQIKTACVYQTIQKLNEVDISPLDAILKKHQIKVLKLGASKAQAMPSVKFDLILVPCLAFDEDNYRLGWGGGFYDRFLAQQPQALKIGLCFQNGFAADGLPREPHDAPLNKVITEI